MTSEVSAEAAAVISVDQAVIIFARQYSLLSSGEKGKYVINAERQMYNAKL